MGHEREIAHYPRPDAASHEPRDRGYSPVIALFSDISLRLPGSNESLPRSEYPVRSDSPGGRHRHLQFRTQVPL